MATKNIRDLRESKSLSQKAVRTACGLTYSTYVRIEQGSGKTTPEEIASVLKVLEKMEPGTRKLAGRPFKDPAKQAAVQEARAAGKSVAAVLANGTAPAPAKKAAAPKKAPAKKAAPNLGKALAGKKAAAKKS